MIHPSIWHLDENVRVPLFSLKKTEQAHRPFFSFYYKVLARSPQNVSLMAHMGGGSTHFGFRQMDESHLI